MRGTGGINAVL